ncbi:hypothetical protein LNN38_25605 [Pseudomonas sp. LA21]|uniref:hypothetical protein n=1 Tax=Pseudomonas sp. LA21 TaxID=2893373 RepID=UPI001FB7197F|nr:hypothetical protein [Pseudomonas sp. LA21]MCJ1888255.1 hypothetical protein [Pseudomonas sp. LA21]
MGVLREKNHKGYLRTLHELHFAWGQCQRAFSILTQTWMDNSNNPNISWYVSLVAKSKLELEGEYLGRPFSVKLIPKVNGKDCLGQVLVTGVDPVSGDSKLVFAFCLNLEGDLVSENGDVETAEDEQLQHFSLLCEMCLRVGEQV